jgi:hypothetical protein
MPRRDAVNGNSNVHLITYLYALLRRIPEILEVPRIRCNEMYPGSVRGETLRQGLKVILRTASKWVISVDEVEERVTLQDG